MPRLCIKTTIIYLFIDMSIGNIIMDIIRGSSSRTSSYWHHYEGRCAQAPLILAPAEVFRRPSGPFGGLRPLLWGLWPLLEAYGLYQYHQWISQHEYMLFDNQHDKIGPKMAKIAYIACNLREIAWICPWTCVKVPPIKFSAWLNAFWCPTCWNWPKMAEIVQIVWKLREICAKLREDVHEIM